MTMFRGTYTYETELNHNIDKVWPLFSSANNLVAITRFPRISIHSDPSTVKGNHIELELSFGLFRLHWLLVILDVQDRAYFIDQAIRMPFPFRAWQHTHSFLQHEERTIMTDTIEFEAYMPTFIIRFLLRRMFRDRKVAIKKLLRSC